MISRDETERLAAMANAMRPDWPTKSLVTFISRELTQRTYREAAVALAWIATDPATVTPRRMLEQGPWWLASRAQAATVSVIATRCGEHPAHPAARCPECPTPEDVAAVDHAAHAAKIRETAAELRRLRKRVTA